MGRRFGVAEMGKPAEGGRHGFGRREKELKKEPPKPIAGVCARTPLAALTSDFLLRRRSSQPDSGLHLPWPELSPIDA